MKSKIFDAIVIGSGPGGQKAAIHGSQLGKKIVMVEALGKPGGFCTHTATIPSKTLKHAADFFKSLDNTLQNPSANQEFLKSTFAQMAMTIKREEEIAASQLKRNGVEIVYGRAAFLDSHKIKVELLEGGDEILEAPHVVIATGSRPRHPDNLKIEAPFFDSDSILQLKKLPKSIIVEGGGVIGTEYACIFHTLGVHVTLVNHHANILHFLDEDIRQNLTLSMTERGICMRMNCKVESYSVENNKAKYTFEDGTSTSAECALICSGREANIENLGLENTGVSIEAWGAIKVDNNYQTTEPNVYAVGDVNGFPSLASAAMVQGRQAIAHCFDKNIDFNEPLIPMGVYTVPEVAAVGKTEEELKKDNTAYAECSCHFTELARAQIDDTREGFLKILFDPKTLEIFGVHIIGRNACDLIHLGQAVMDLGGTLEYLKNLPANFPTYSGAYKVAAINGFNSVRKKM